MQEQYYIYELKLQSAEVWHQLKQQIINEVPNYKRKVWIFELGVLYEGGEYDEDGNEIEPPVQIEGYHVDVKSIELLPFLNQHIIVVNNPRHGERWKEGCVVVQPY